MNTKKELCTTDAAESSMHPRCFKCERPVKCAVASKDAEEYWEAPWGVSFFGGDNFGSSMYDSFVDELSVGIRIIVCDDCLKVNMGLVRETGEPLWGLKNKKDGEIAQDSVGRHVPEKDASPGWEHVRVSFVNGRYVEVQKNMRGRMGWRLSGELAE